MVRRRVQPWLRAGNVEIKQEFVVKLRCARSGRLPLLACDFVARCHFAVNVGVEKPLDS